MEILPVEMVDQLRARIFSHFPVEKSQPCKTCIKPGSMYQDLLSYFLASELMKSLDFDLKFDKNSHSEKVGS